MNTLRMGVIGLGKMGLHMIKQAMDIQMDRPVEIAAVCDTNEEGLKAFAEAYPSIKTYLDYQHLLDEQQMDLVYIAVPPKYHYPVVMEVLKRNIHVFCEKPLANSLEEASRMVEAAEQAAERAGVVHAVHFSMPHEPAVLKLQEMVKQHAVGHIRRIDLILQFPQWPRSWQQNEWITSREQGGFILEVGIHWIHMIQHVFGPLEVVEAQVTYPADQPNVCEQEVQAVLELPGGTRIYMQGISHFAGEERVSMVVYGTEGTIALENWEELMSGPIGQPLSPVEVLESSSELPVLKHVINRIEGKPGKIYTFQDGYEAQMILEKLRENN
ncbi:Inositol 2-dehydrogenase/D-chiro-inositol 3-dehydrogenase [Paenibacillus sp. JJ-100]|uniref:Gfo/Idh/MocA family protein n=1 Tax=Paenibacillus sp. JJ-100 TaxID=2974896 RepID=UPI0022FF67E8|nr:Gfo/Idh/MocA family oxidoreductase [Paenibacillus sp. JJ-100]CAI6021744.1 Inositol 2-dehydrogenase/D-chiro-inositol 3-dehydrogenase [Paenibacillus sp. JJ-100]